MTVTSDKRPVGRREFMTALGAAGIGAAGAASALSGPSPAAENTSPPPPLPRGAPMPSIGQMNAETEIPQSLPTAGTAHPGADFMVDVLRSLRLPYIFANPGSSFRGLQESVINYGNNSAPEFLTCMHEESSVAMAQGYYKASGVPAAIFAHGTVGTQHASMAFYNAWCDRVPVIAILGNTVNATTRRPGIDWLHSAQDPAAIIRDFTKWDDQPASLQHFAESMVRAYKIATTPQMGPVAVVADTDLQEGELKDREALSIPAYTPNVPPQGDSGAVREVARLLVAAERPVIIADRLARTPAGMTRLVELAELLNVPVIDKGNRANFPSMHYLAQWPQARQLIREADLILGLEVADFYGVVHEYIDNAQHTTTSVTAKGAKLVSIGVQDLFIRSNYQDFQRFQSVDLSIAGDGEETLPALIEAVKSGMSNLRQTAVAARADQFKKSHAAAFEKARIDASYGWNASPISTARLAMELWQQIKTEDWVMVSPYPVSWIRRLWNFDQYHRMVGNSGGEGVGYGLPGSVGAAVAHKPHGRLCVNLQRDGDFMYANGALWTAAHHRIPLLTVMYNNRAYQQETMHLQRMAARWSRGLDRTHIGTTITDPFIDYAKIAHGMGVWAEGPITDPKTLAPALRRAIAVVKSGLPALVDVVTQPR